MNNLNKTEFVPIVLEDYVPNVVRRLANKIIQNKNSTIVLFGFGDNMKWLYRILKENNTSVLLCDWREKFVNYDCGGENLQPIKSLNKKHDLILVNCLSDINEIKESIKYIIENDLHHLKMIFDTDQENLPFEYESPYNIISKRALNRAKSMITNEQLFDLIQFIEQTKSIEGDVLEFGSLHGGSGAVIAEAVNYFCKEKKIYLFDTFDGIPESKFGLDFHWKGSFSNNSYEEVKNAFSDMNNVDVIKGNIIETCNNIKNKISFGYLASDTYETGKILLELMWKNLNKGGIIAVCDYGSFPNCYPLTVLTDIFIENNKNDILVYRPARVGIFIMKR